MCGRYVTPDERAIESYFRLGRHNWKGWVQRYNVSPTMPVPMIYLSRGEVLGEVARWGLIPSWWKNAVPPSMTFNARSEEAAFKPTWRNSMQSARCLMPARGWYEWNENEPITTSAGRKGHQPYYFYDAESGVVAIAGLWSMWHAPNGPEVLTCALLTKEATVGTIAQIHHRMPVVVDPSQFEKWLSPGSSATEVAAMIAGSRSDFVAHRVSTKVNNTRNESPDLIEEAPPPSNDSRHARRS